MGKQDDDIIKTTVKYSRKKKRDKNIHIFP